jgi:hypothetical protein
MADTGSGMEAATNLGYARLAMGRKQRITLTLDRDLIARAKRLAHQRGIRFSDLVESSLQELLASKPRRVGSFVERWAGRFSVREDDGSDPRLAALKAKHGLTS